MGADLLLLAHPPPQVELNHDSITAIIEIIIIKIIEVSIIIIRIIIVAIFQSPDVFFLYFHESEEFVAVNRSDHQSSVPNSSDGLILAKIRAKDGRFLAKRQANFKNTAVIQAFFLKCPSRGANSSSDGRLWNTSKVIIILHCRLVSRWLTGLGHTVIDLGDPALQEELISSPEVNDE